MFCTIPLAKWHKIILPKVKIQKHTVVCTYLIKDPQILQAVIANGEVKYLVKLLLNLVNGTLQLCKHFI